MTTNTGLHAVVPTALRERWRDESVASVWLRPADWYHPAVDALALALLTGQDVLGAAEQLGRARGHDGVGIAEAIDDLGCLYHATGRAEPPLPVLRALCDGWADAQAGAVAFGTSLDPESGLPSSQYLAVRLAEAYHDQVADEDDQHHLVVVDVATGQVDRFSRSARCAAVGAAMTSTFGHGHPMATLGGGVFAVLSRPQDDLGTHVDDLQAEIARRVAALDVRAVTRRPVRIWVEPLPRTHDEAVARLTHIARS